jgi:hypothetical protein
VELKEKKQIDLYGAYVPSNTCPEWYNKYSFFPGNLFVPVVGK